jgi:DNA polymerase V
MPVLLLHDLPFEIVPLEARLLLCSTPAGFRSPATDDIEEPIDSGTWLIEYRRLARFILIGRLF